MWFDFKGISGFDPINYHFDLKNAEKRVGKVWIKNASPNWGGIEVQQNFLFNSNKNR